MEFSLFLIILITEYRWGRGGREGERGKERERPVPFIDWLLLVSALTGD